MFLVAYAPLGILGDVRALGHLSTGARRALWVGGVLVVLAGVLGMHGLSTHGMDVVAPAPSSAHAVHSMVTGSDAGSPMVSPADSEMVMAAVGLPDHGGMAMSAGAMCLAILIGALIALLRHRHGQASRLWFATTPPRPVAVRRARSPDPPSLIALSVQRC